MVGDGHQREFDCMHFIFSKWCDDAATDTALPFGVLFCLCRAVPLPCLRRPSLGAIDQRRVAPVPRKDHHFTWACHTDETPQATPKYVRAARRSYAQTKHSLRSALTDADWPTVSWLAKRSADVLLSSLEFWCTEFCLLPDITFLFYYYVHIFYQFLPSGVIIIKGPQRY